MRCTIARALRDMRHLRTTDAGRLRGIHLRRSAVDVPRRAIAGTPQPLRDQLRAGIDARATGTVTGDSPEYLVLSDGTVVAVLTAAARVLLANHPLTPLQTRHRQAATTTDVDPGAALAQFAAAYLGPFRDERDDIRHRMGQLGWTRALRTAGIPDRYLDLPAITRDWFDQQVRRVDSGTRDHIEVFHRHRPGAGTETPS